jgi:hypothetical protein
MTEMSLWELILLGVLLVVLIFWFRPGLRESLKRSAEAKEKDWAGLLVPLAMVLLFVLLLISLVR